MQYFRSFIKLCSFSVTKMKTLGTQSVPSHPTRLKKKNNNSCMLRMPMFLLGGQKIHNTLD